MVRIHLPSEPLLRQGWRQVLQYRCTEAGGNLYSNSTWPSHVCVPQARRKMSENEVAVNLSGPHVLHFQHQGEEGKSMYRREMPSPSLPTPKQNYWRQNLEQSICNANVQELMIALKSRRLRRGQTQQYQLKSKSKLGWAEPHSRFPLSFPLISP